MSEKSSTSKRTVTLSEQTVEWVELAVKDYDPLTATTAENTPEKLACWAIHNLIHRDPYDSLAETLGKLPQKSEEP